MERAAWTDERLDDLAESMRSGFARVDQDVRDLRVEMRDGFAEIRGEIDALRQTMIRIGGGMIAGMSVGFLSVLAAILARGA
jgi:argininosuccinate lyase